MNTSGESSSNNNNMLEFQGYNQELVSWPSNLQPPYFSPNYSSLPPLPPPSPTLHYPFYGDVYTSRRAALQFANEGGGGFYNYNYMHGGGEIRGLSTSSLASLPLGNACFELGKAMSAQDIMDAKALAASKSHSEAERRRRERINVHLARLRSLLPSTTKTDKASLLAEVIQHVKELKRQTSELAEENPLPTESDELTLDTTCTEDEEQNGKFVVKASLCCDDRADLLPELIKALKALRLRTLKAEITTIGGRVKNVLVITGDYENFEQRPGQESVIGSIQEALKAVMERADEAVTGGGSKRQRTTSMATILEHNSV